MLLMSFLPRNLANTSAVLPFKSLPLDCDESSKSCSLPPKNGFVANSRTRSQGTRFQLGKNAVTWRFKTRVPDQIFAIESRHTQGLVSLSTFRQNWNPGTPAITGNTCWQQPARQWTGYSIPLLATISCKRVVPADTPCSPTVPLITGSMPARKSARVSTCWRWRMNFRWRATVLTR